jgi:PAS domain S-box-containing protein
VIQKSPVHPLDEHSPASVARSSTFEQFLELAPDAVVAIDTGGEIIVANSQAEALFGYSRDDLIGGRVETLVPERFGEAYVGHRASYFENQSSRPNGEGLELFGRRKDGTEFPAEINLSSIETEDGVLATAAIRDISDRVQVEREKAQLEAQLEQSRFETVGQLAGGVAHDFNNILGVIMNYAEFVSEEIGPNSRAAADIEEIRAAAERATALTRQLLIFSRRDVVAPQVLGLNDRIADLESLLEQALGERVDLEAELDADLWPVEIDPGQIDQVLVNLVVNARDAMPGGGTVRIATANVELDEGFPTSLPPTEPGTYVQFTVSDTGTGMSEEVVARALEPFFTTKPKGQGTGLGLATVHGILTGAGGTLYFFSEPDIGTTVKVHLPVATGTVADHRPAPPENVGGQGENVLLVEDDPGVRRMTERILREGGYEVIVAEGGEEALRVLNEGAAVDLLLTDVIMPKMLGTELATRARVERPDLRLIFMSGYNELVGQERAGSPGDWDASLVEKPYSIDTLLGAIREVIDAEAVK